MVKIAILDSDVKTFERLTLKREILEYYSVKDTLKSHIKFIDVNKIKDVFDSMNKYVIKEKNDIVNIADIYYTSEYNIQAMFLQSNEGYNSNKINLLGSQLNNGNSCESNMLLIKRNITNDNFDYVDITIDDIIQMVIDTFLHKGVILRHDGRIDQYEYIYDPLEWTIQKETHENIRYHEFKLLNFVMTFYVNKNEKQESEKFNKNATVIYGKNIYGDVILSLRDTESISSNHNLTTETIEKILKIFYVRKPLNENQYRLNPTNENNEITDEHDVRYFPSITKYPNFYMVIENEYFRLKKYENININETLFSDVLNNIDVVIELEDAEFKENDKQIERVNN
jgi:hypothetical protein